MWRPPAARKHSLPVLGEPTAEAAARARWFQPISVGGCRLATRTWIPAMVPWRATDDGFVTPDLLAWYERFARGRPGALVVEATGIRDGRSSGPLRADVDAGIRPWFLVGGAAGQACPLDDARCLA